MPSAEVIARAAELLTALAGARVEVIGSEPAAAGWSVEFEPFPWLAALTVSGWSSPSVIVKTPRPDDHWRTWANPLREVAALELLADVGSPVAPRLIATEPDAQLLILEDLGRGPAVEDVLLGADRTAAAEAVVAHAVALARMQAATIGQADTFYRRLVGVDRDVERVTLQVMPFRQRWEQLASLVRARAYLPSPDPAEPDVRRLLAWMAGAGPMLALSNGDFMPQNTRVAEGAVRLLDFEDALFQHALLDAAHLRIPYAAAPAWARLPPDVTRRCEVAYRTELVGSCPQVGDDRWYDEGMANAVAAWTVNRLTRLADLEAQDKPHPLGYSRRGQLLDLLATAVESCRVARTLPGLGRWLEQVAQALRRRWPEVEPQQALYPAFRQ